MARTHMLAGLTPSQSDESAWCAAGLVQTHDQDLKPGLYPTLRLGPVAVPWQISRQQFFCLGAGVVEQLGPAEAHQLLSDLTALPHREVVLLGVHARALPN
jgi:hypothetical protein